MGCALNRLGISRAPNQGISGFRRDRPDHKGSQELWRGIDHSAMGLQGEKAPRITSRNIYVTFMTVLGS